MTQEMRTPQDYMMRRIEIVLDWASRHTSFDTTFVESLKRQVEHFGHITPLQLKALEKLIEDFKME